MTLRPFLLLVCLLASAWAVAQPILKDSGATACDSLYIKYIVITGNEITKRHIILRELEYNEGSKLAIKDTSNLFRVGRNRIFNLRLFVTVQQRVIQLNLPGTGCAQSVLVEIEVRERWYIFPFPIIELADRSFNEWIYNQGANFRRINYGVRVEANNIRGRNETLKMIGQLGFTRKAEITYAIPYLSKRLKEGLTFGAQYITNKQVASESDSNKQNFFRITNSGTVYRRFTGGAEFSYRPLYWITHRLSTNFFWAQIADTVAQKSPDYFLDTANTQRYFHIAYSFTYDRRDIRQYPLKGFFFSVSGERLGILPTDKVNIWSAHTEINQHTPLGGRWFLANGISATASTPWRQPYAQSRFLGFGQTFVRGYEKYVMESPVNFVLKNTLRYRLFRKTVQVEDMPLQQFAILPFAIYVKAFVDAGYARNPLARADNGRLLNTALGGAGVGVDFVTYYDYVFRFEYSFTRQGEQGLFFHVAVEI